MRRRISEWTDNLHLLDDRAGPSVRNDQRQGIFVFGTDVDEVNVESVDLGDELRQGVHFCFDLAPVILCRPIARQRLHRRQLYSLGCIGNRFAFRPLGRVDAPAQFGEFGFRNIHMERVNGGLVRSLVNGGLGNSVAVMAVCSSEVDFPHSADTSSIAIGAPLLTH